MLYLSVRTFVLIAYSLLVGCEQSTELDSKLPIANAGPDQPSQVGSYVVLNGSQSTPGNGSKIVLYEWQQDENNPVQFMLFPGETDTTQTLGFTKEGIYKFYLVVSNGAQTSQPDEVKVTVKPRDDFNFADPNLEISVRYALKRPEQKLTDGVLLTLDSLRAPWFVCVNDLNGIQKCANLKGLYMSLQHISDLSPLSNLKQLVWLDLDQNYRIKDVSPLAGLTQLQHLNLDSNEITDISPLRDCTQLKYFNLQLNTKVNDISVVANMKELEELWLANSPVGNISSVAELKNLYLLWLAKCEITDITSITNLANLRLLFLKYN